MKIEVRYYSRGGNTKKLAEAIAAADFAHSGLYSGGRLCARLLWSGGFSAVFMLRKAG